MSERGLSLCCSSRFASSVFSPRMKSDAVNDGIYNIATLVPAILYIIVGLVLAFVYTLDKKKVLENVEILKARKNNENADA